MGRGECGEGGVWGGECGEGGSVGRGEYGEGRVGRVGVWGGGSVGRGECGEGECGEGRVGRVGVWGGESVGRGGTSAFAFVLLCFVQLANQKLKVTAPNLPMLDDFTSYFDLEATNVAQGEALLCLCGDVDRVIFSTLVEETCTPPGLQSFSNFEFDQSGRIWLR